MALDGRRQSQRAEPWLLEALQINRIAIENVRALIECLHNQGRFKDASRLVREYLVVDPSNRSLLQLLIETAKKWASMMWLRILPASFKCWTSKKRRDPSTSFGNKIQYI